MTSGQSVLVKASVCTKLAGEACKYDGSQACSVVDSNESIATCVTDTSLNSIACYANVQEACDFKGSCQTMSADDLDRLNCSDARGYGQCVHITKEGQICKWDGSSCSEIAAPNSDCTALSNININGCMAAANAAQKCQFKDEGSSTKCEVPADDA